MFPRISGGEFCCPLPSRLKAAHEAAALTSSHWMIPPTRKPGSGWKLSSEANGRSSQRKAELDQADRFKAAWELPPPRSPTLSRSSASDGSLISPPSRPILG
jgi:hypothetical protein